MRSEPLRQKIRKGQGETSPAQNPSVQRMRRRRLRQEGFQLEGYVPGLHAVDYTTLSFPPPNESPLSYIPLGFWRLLQFA